MGLRELRQAKGLTLKGLAALSGVNYMKIHQIETGKINPENIALKTGEPITLVVVEKDKPFDGDVMFMLKDCLRDTYPMNDDYTNAGGWKASKLRKVLNTEILALLPDDMRAAIKPRVIDGESDLLWLASEMEVFGLHDWTENDPDRGE